MQRQQEQSRSITQTETNLGIEWHPLPKDRRLLLRVSQHALEGRLSPLTRWNVREGVKGCNEYLSKIETATEEAKALPAILSEFQIDLKNTN